MVDYKNELSPKEQNKKIDIRYTLLYIMVTAYTVFMLLDALG
ncbi:MAG: hypothetical protein ACI94Y_003878 [Maribacter sp.]|jgi:hypothetical protein